MIYLIEAGLTQELRNLASCLKTLQVHFFSVETIRQEIFSGSDGNLGVLTGVFPIREHQDFFWCRIHTDRPYYFLDNYSALLAAYGGSPAYVWVAGFAASGGKACNPHKLLRTAVECRFIEHVQ